MNKINWNTKAIKQLRKLPQQIQKRVSVAVDALAQFPEGHADVKPLHNHRIDYRLRVGAYRVLFNHNETIKIIQIEEVKKRNDRTY